MISIYINPKQFNSKSDFNKYPRDPKKDLAILKKHKVDYVFLPNDVEIYERIFTKKIFLPMKEKILCARFRKGHFEGVLNVMNKFLTIIKPKYIFMGEKDFQQLYLIKKFVISKFKAKILVCKTVRDTKFFALSSRNKQLTKVDLYKTGLIARHLFKFKKKIQNNSKAISLLIEQKKYLRKKFKIKVEYLEARLSSNLKTYKFKKKFKLFVAYYISKIRIIDNF